VIARPRHLRPLVIENENGEGSDAVGVQADGQADEEVPELADEDFEGDAVQAEEGPVVEEDPVVRAIRDPGQPTPEEVAAHELTHLPFRPWCPDCVSGRAADDPHRRIVRDADDGVPKVSVDYGFISSDDGEDTRAILVLKVSGTKVVSAKCVSGKGRVDPFAVGWLVDELRRLGLGRCILQADGEPAQRTFVRDVIDEVSRVSTIGVAAAHSPAYDHKANGGVEKAVRDVKDHVRTLRGALTRKVGATKTSDAIFDWLVVYAAELLTGARVGHDGMTAHRRLRGRNWQPRLANFAEQVLARRPRALEQGDAEPRWDQATYLGTRWGSAEHWVACEDGLAVKVRTIRRVSNHMRWSLQRVTGVTGVPDEPGRIGEAAAVEQQVEVVPHVEIPGAVPAPRLTRGFRIEACDLRDHGYTLRCAKCDSLRAGRHVGTGHSNACRERFRIIFEAADDGRVERAADRRDGPADIGAEIVVANGEAAIDPEDVAADGLEWDMDIYDDPAMEGLEGIAEENPEAMDIRAFRQTTSRRWADVCEDSDAESDLGAWATYPVEDKSLVATIQRGAAQVNVPKEEVRRTCYITGLDEQQSEKVVTELFSPPRVNANIQKGLANAAGFVNGTSFDMIVDQQSGERWNFLEASDRRKCWERLKQEDPWIVIGSPPCTAFCALNIGLNKNRGDPVQRERRRAEGQVLLGFALGVYAWQVGRCKYFLHEHPASASSWSMPEVIAVQKMEGVTTAVSDACVFGMTAVDSDGQERLVKKPTKWMSNAPRLLASLGYRCNGRHQHTPLLGGRAANAAIYPPELVLAIVRGLQAQREEDARRGKTTTPLSEAILSAISEVPLQTGGTAKDTYDEYTGVLLDPVLVAKGKEEELKYFKTKTVWEIVARASSEGRKIVGTRWICSNKGDEDNPEIRCRLVCQEVKTYQTEEFFAATPPLETLRMILSIAAENPEKDVSLVDISRAYFNAFIEREVFVELPKEAGCGKGVIGRLVKCMYGTRDAAQGWEGTYRQALEAMGFQKGKASPCVFGHLTRDISLTVHGDDFFATALPADLEWYEKELLKKFEGKVKGRLKQKGDELRVLNRIVRRAATGYEWEADQRHAELLIAGARLAEDSRPLNNPGRKLSTKELETEAVPLDAAEASIFRAKAARANFLASDRPDIAFAVKELCRGMSSPTDRDNEALKRLSRYLLGRPRLILHFMWQEEPGHFDVFSDSDWAGCIKTRKSTSGGALLRGSHVLKTWCTTQSTVALSSAEAELVAAVRGAAEGLSARSLAQDLGSECQLRLHIDSSAAIGICKRSGIGKIRHLDTRLLWIQDLVRNGTINVLKVPGEVNPADLMTKHLCAENISAHLARLCCWEREGRATCAPKCH
jgi:hypothetical protein